MKKIVLTYGVIAGSIVSLVMLISIAIGCDQMDNNVGMFIGFTAMIIAFSLIFVAVRNFRDKLNSGVITFGKAFQIGLYISLIASSFYVISWLVDFYFFIPDFMDKYTARAIEQLNNSGASATEVQSKTAEIMHMKEMYKNPLMVVLFTFAEILPIGIVFSLFAALYLKKRPANAMVA